MPHRDPSNLKMSALWRPAQTVGGAGVRSSSRAQAPPRPRGGGGVGAVLCWRADLRAVRLRWRPETPCTWHVRAARADAPSQKRPPAAARCGLRQLVFMGDSLSHQAWMSFVCSLVAGLGGHEWTAGWSWAPDGVDFSGMFIVNNNVTCVEGGKCEVRLS